MSAALAGQLDLLALLSPGDEAGVDIPALIAARLFSGHERRYAVLEHQRGARTYKDLVRMVGEESGGSGMLDDRVYSWWTARRNGVIVAWCVGRDGAMVHEELSWSVVVAAALAALSPARVADLDAAEARRRAVAGEAKERFSRLALHHPDGTPVMWTAKYDTSIGLKKGDKKPGARCWLCGQIEPNPYWLNVRHGLDEAYPDSLDRETCTVRDREQRLAEPAAKT